LSQRVGSIYMLQRYIDPRDGSAGVVPAVWLPWQCKTDRQGRAFALWWPRNNLIVRTPLRVHNLATHRHAMIWAWVSTDSSMYVPRINVDGARAMSFPGLETPQELSFKQHSLHR
jgi:hypothetical protein